MTISIEQLAGRQIRLWEALKAERMATPVMHAVRSAITISRESGIEVAELARRLGHRLGYGVWDQEIIDYVANTVGVRRQLIQSLEEQKQSAVERWVEGALHGHLVDASDYARTLVHVLRALGEQGGVIVRGRGGNFVMPPETTLRVRVVAPLAWRAQSAWKPGENAEQAARRLADEDQKRAEFVHRHMKADARDPAAYDLVLNAERFDTDAQERLILEALHTRF